MDFGVIRSLAQAPPSSEAWEELCATLDRVDAPRDLERALGYLEGALRRWPDELRVVPKIWHKAMIHEGKDAMRVARLGILKQAYSNQIEGITAAKARGMRHLERLELQSYGGPIGPIAELLGVEGLRDLNELALASLQARTVSTLEQWEQLREAVRAHEGLEAFELRGNKGFVPKYYKPLLEKSLGVESLTIERSGFGRDQVELLTHQVSSGLRSLDLGASSLEDAGWIELAGLNLSGLETLRLDRSRGGDAGARRLAACPLPNLERLSLLHVNMTEVGVAAWMGARFERLRELEIDLSGSHKALAVALENAQALDALEHVTFRFNSDHDEGLCEAMAKSSLFGGVREVHVLALDAPGLEVLLRSEALSGVERLTLEQVHMGDGVWDALAGADHLSNLTDLTIKRAHGDALGEPGYGRFCAAEGLRTLQRLTYDQCKWNGLQRLANSARVGTLTSLTLRNTEFSADELTRLFANEGVERMERFELFPGRLMTAEEATACIGAPRHPSSWSPPFSALKALSRAEAREAQRRWARW